MSTMDTVSFGGTRQSARRSGDPQAAQGDALPGQAAPAPEACGAGAGAGWAGFLCGLVARGQSGVKPVISDGHEGLEQAVAELLPGGG